eukprot:CAMPEP_0175132944 /NCGR_PEP_ID=MMETSP0087-20121206/7357_1 /TAXON_ID=136419 /ORGANISM="Unknown Unknown, Strain D1" /LENGTH=908 /DNA_ID=CAMNT_0016415357 /DNA_START=114 /DNA_END=2838 /DNA_ORIENTATION=-
MWAVYHWEASTLLESQFQTILDRVANQGLTVIEGQIFHAAIASKCVQALHNFDRAINMQDIGSGTANSDPYFDAVKSNFNVQELALGQEDGSYFSIDSNDTVAVRSNQTTPVARKKMKLVASSGKKVRQLLGYFTELNFDVRSKQWYKDGKAMFQASNPNTYTEGKFVDATELDSGGRGTIFIQPLVTWTLTQTEHNQPAPSFTGVLKVEILFSKLGKSMSQLSIKNGFVFIIDFLDPLKRVVTSSRGDLSLPVASHPSQDIQTLGSYVISDTSNKIYHSLNVGDSGYLVSSKRFRMTGALDWKIVTVIPQANLEGTFSSLNVTSALILAMVVILWGFQVFLMLQVVPLVHHAMKYKFNKFRHGVLTSTAFIENGKRCWQGGIPPVETDEKLQETYELVFTREKSKFKLCRCSSTLSFVQNLRLHKGRRLNFLLYFCAVAVATLTLILRFTWQSTLDSMTIEVTKGVVIESSSQVQASLSQEFSYPISFMHIVNVLAQNGRLVLRPPVGKYDSLYFDFMRAFTKPVFNSSGPSTEYIIDMMFHGTTDGYMFGSQRFNASTLRVAGLDTSTAYPSVCLYNQSNKGVGSLGPYDKCYQKWRSSSRGFRVAPAGHESFNEYYKKCSYSVLVRPWYKLGMSFKTKDPKFTTPYNFASGYVGLSAVLPLFYANDTKRERTPMAVLTTDFDLSSLSKLMIQVARATDDAQHILYLVDANWITYASSTGEQSTPDGKLLAADQAQNARVAESAKIIQQLEKDNPSLWRSPGVKEVPRLVSEPKTSTIVYQVGGSQLRLVLLLDLAKFDQSLDQMGVISIIMLAYTVVSLFILSKSAILSAGKYKLPRPAPDLLEHELVLACPKQQKLKETSLLISPVIKHWESVAADQGELGTEILSRSAAGQNILYHGLVVQQG